VVTSCPVLVKLLSAKLMVPGKGSKEVNYTYESLPLQACEMTVEFILISWDKPAKRYA